jgi:UDP-N-acetylglucosamine 2-epimerase (non-hydrolysing)
MAPLLAEMKKERDLRGALVHTGQHDDWAVSDLLFRDLDLPQPDVFLNVGSGSHARQTALIIQGFEGVLLDLNPDLVLVIGDFNCAVGCSMTAIKLGFPVAHVEAGLRSFDREMPEEINRILTDSVADLLFASERRAVKNLQREGVSTDRIFFVGNLLIDAVKANGDKIARSSILGTLGLVPRTYGVAALRCPCNLEDEQRLGRITAALERLQSSIHMVCSLPGSGRSALEKSSAWRRLSSLPNVQFVEVLGYLDFMKLLGESMLVLTDSGPIQEETTALRIPCLTLMESTERPSTVTHGTNRLVGVDLDRISSESMAILNGSAAAGRLPDKWDGQASRRIVEVLLRRENDIRQMYRSLRRRGLCSGVSSAA